MQNIKEMASAFIGLVTSQDYPNLPPQEQPWLHHLKEAGLQAVPVVWSDTSVNWSNFSHLVVRTCWDYHFRLPEFTKWLDKIQGLNIPVFNPISVIRQNLHKSYLLDLESQGVAIVPTRLIKRGENVDLKAAYLEFQSDEVVVKPASSAGAYRTLRLHRNDSERANAALRQLGQTHDLLIQPFMTEVVSEGEWSLQFFNKQFSHAVLKQPKSNDFRVQKEYGGKYGLTNPSETAITTGAKLLKRIHDPLLFARVDGIIHQNQFLLMELELIEPELFLFNKTILERLTDAFQYLLQ